MRLIVAGCRDFEDADLVYRELDRSRAKLRSGGGDLDCVVSGCASGVDTIALCWAEHHGVPVVRYPADWATHGRRAGPLRNAVMARNADGLLAIWDGRSRGTRSMIDEARKAGLPVRVVEIGREPVLTRRPPDPNPTPGKRLRAERDAAGLTLGDLARALGVRVTVVSDWEHSRQEPTPQQRQAMASLFARPGGLRGRPGGLRG